MKKILFVLVLLISQYNWAQKDDFKDDIVKYLNISGQRKTFEFITKDLANTLPESRQIEFKEDLKQSIDVLINNIAENYKQEFTHKEIKDLIKFYESKTGKKLVTKWEILNVKGEQIGHEWGTYIHQLLKKHANDKE